jgi:hypothetical protein
MSFFFSFFKSLVAIMVLKTGEGKARVGVFNRVLKNCASGKIDRRLKTEGVEGQTWFLGFSLQPSA